MCGSHLCVSSRTCTCMIGVFLGLSPSSFAFSRCGDIQHYLLLAQWFEFLHADFYKDMLKYDNIMIAEDGIECSKDNDKVFFYFSTFDKYPDAEKVLQEALNTQTTPLPQVRFDMKIIQRLNKSLFESDKCVATFKGTNKVIVFDSMMEGVSSVGLLMPCYSEDTEE